MVEIALQLPAKIEAVLKFLDQPDEKIWGIEDLRVTRSGDIAPRDRSRPIRFSFTCLRMPVKAEARAAGGKIDLELAAVIGAVPFTAEAAEARKRILTRVRGQKGLLLTDGRNLCAYSRAVLSGPLQPETLMTELVSFMLAVKPEIEGLEPLLPGRLHSRTAVAA